MDELKAMGWKKAEEVKKINSIDFLHNESRRLKY
jgi:hypothetical protein